MLAPRLAAGLLLAAVLSGCAGDEPSRPRALPSPSSAAASPSPSIAASPSPADDRAAVEAAVRFYYDGYNRAYEANDPKELAAGSSPDCPCRRKVALVEAALAKGRIEGNRVTVHAVRIIDLVGDKASAEATYTSTPGRVVAADGRVVEPLQGETNTSRTLQVDRVAGVWKVVNEVNFGG